MKELIAADLDVFIELEEFAERVTFNGVELSAVLMRHTAEKSARLAETFDGLHGDFATIYFKVEDYGKPLPHQGEWALINGRRYDVMSSEEEMGMAKLICAAYRQSFKKM